MLVFSDCFFRMCFFMSFTIYVCLFHCVAHWFFLCGFYFVVLHICVFGFCQCFVFDGLASPSQCSFHRGAMLCFDKGGVEECRELAGRDLSSRREEGIDTPCQVLCEICIWNIFCILSIWSPCQVLCCVKYLRSLFYSKHLIWYSEYLKASPQWGARPSNSELTLI